MRTIEYNGYKYRVFQGSETSQSATTGNVKWPGAWYYEPADYEGDALWSNRYVDLESACSAAYSASLEAKDQADALADAESP